MSTKKHIFYGDVDVVPSSDTATYGVGVLTIPSLVSTDSTLTDVMMDGNIIMNDNPIVREPTSYGVDAAIHTKLYQTENDIGQGEAVNIPSTIDGVLQSHSGLAVNQIALDAGSSTTVGAYSGYYIRMTSGRFIDQVRLITSYTGGTSKVAQVGSWTMIGVGTVTVTSGSANVAGVTSTSFTTDFSAGDICTINSVQYVVLSVSSNTAMTLTSNVGANFTGTINKNHPEIGDAYTLYGDTYASIVYDKATNAWKFGYTASAANDDNIIVDNLADISVANVDLTAINGVPYVQYGFVEVVGLADNSSTPVDIVNSTTVGVYEVLIQAVGSGACAVFSISKSDSTKYGVVNIVTSSVSTTGESIDIIYGPSQKLQLFHATTKTGGSGATINYNVKIERFV